MRLSGHAQKYIKDNKFGKNGFCGLLENFENTNPELNALGKKLSAIVKKKMENEDFCK